MIVALQRRLEQVRQRKWIVLVVAVLALVIVACTTLPAHPTYSGKSSLVVSSTGRPTDQDALMAVGYATLFNDPATIARLRATQPIPADVALEARTAAASPILTIEATANDPQVAQSAARDMAKAFRDDINLVRQKATDDAVADLERRLEELRDQPAPDGALNPAIGPLQDRIDTMRFDSTNQLQDLQLWAGVVKKSPNVALNFALGTLGGLVLGVLAALGLAALSSRLRNSADVREKTGIEPLVELPPGGSVQHDRIREDRLRTLTNVVNFDDRPKSMVLALTDTWGVREARNLAEALATLSATQGYRTVLVYADNEESQFAVGDGFNDALTDSSLVHALLKTGDVESLTVLPPGRIVVDRYSRVTPARVIGLLDELRTSADTIIVAAPAVVSSNDTQVICAAADFTVLVMDSRVSRAGDVTSAADALTNAHATLLGAILIEGSGKRSTGRSSAKRLTYGRGLQT